MSTRSSTSSSLDVHAKKPLIGAPCTLLAVITQKKSEELALRVLPEVASARMQEVMVAGAQLFSRRGQRDDPSW